MKNRQLFKLGAGAGLVTMLLGALMVLAPSAGADHLGPVPEDAVLLPAGGGAVPICHATNAETNPYILNTPNVNANGEFYGANHASHLGPVFEMGMKKAKVVWGDIIPPIAVDGHLVFTGSQNWNEGGAEQYAQCSAEPETPDAPVIIVEKDVPGEAIDPTEFSFTVNGGEPTSIDESESFETTVSAGTVTITEQDAEGYSLTGVACTRDYVAEGEVIEGEALADEWSGEGGTASFDARNGDIITCVFTNTLEPQQTASITVDKTNNANGSLPFSDAEQASGPAAAVPFQVVISNTGTTDLTLDTLTDTWDGLGTPIDLLTQEGFSCTRGGESQALAAGDTLPAGSVTTCSFTLPGYAPAAGGSKTNTVAIATDEEVDDVDTSTVTTPNPQVVVIPTPPTPPALTYAVRLNKRNDADGDGQFRNSESAIAEGADVTFQVTIRNTGTGALTLSSLTDSFDGELVDLLAGGVDLECNDGAVTLSVGSVLAPGSTTTCTFELEDYAPAAGTDRTNTIAVDTDQTTPGTDESTVSTPEVLSEEEVPPVVTPPVQVPPAATPTPAAQPSAVLGVQTVRSLPRTGDETRSLAGVGALMLAMGAAMVLASKRQLSR